VPSRRALSDRISAALDRRAARSFVSRCAYSTRTARRDRTAAVRSAIPATKTVRTSRRMRRLRSTVRSRESVSHAEHGLDVGGLRRIGLDLPAEVHDVRIDRSVEPIEVRSEGALHQLLARECAAGRARKRLEEPELAGREGNPAAANAHLVP